MSKLAWYVVIMVPIDVLLYIVRFAVKSAKSEKQEEGPSGETS